MSWSFNPFTGNLDLVGSGGGTSYIDGDVEYHSNLPVTAGTPAVNSAFLVRKGEGLYFISRKPAGIWVRELNNGNLDDWKFAGLFSDLYRDANFRIISDSDVSKELAFDVSGVTTGTTRTITVPNKNVTLDDAGDSRTPTSHAASHAAAGSDPVFNQNLNTADSVEFGELLVTGAVNFANAVLNDFSFNTSVLLKDNNDHIGTLSVDADSLSANRLYTLPDASGTLALTTTAPASHAHGNLTNAGAIGSTAGLPVVTTTSGAITTLALGAANTVLKVNSGGTAVEFGAAGGVTSGNIDNAVLRADGTGGSASQSSDLIVDDPVVAFACTGDASTDIITTVGHNFTENQRVRFQSLTGGSGLFFGGPASSTTYFVRNISGNTFQVSTTSGGAAVNFTTNITAGAVLAIQRNLTLRTRKQAFSMTADAATNVITATGHTFVNGDAVSFYNLTGGNGLDEVSRWYVIEADTNTFKVSNSLNGTARDITADYTGGTVELEIPLVLGLPRSSALILGDKPDGTLIGGNLRGYGAVDFQTNRNGQNAIASGPFSFIGNGQNNTASGTRATVLGGTGNTANNTDAVVCGGEANGASGVRSIVCGGSSNNATAQWACIGGGTENTNSGVAAFVSGASNTATGAQSGILCGRNAGADRENIFAHATGRFGAQGDAQTVRVSLRNRASTATAVELFMGFNADARFPIPSGKTMSALINIIAATSGGEFANRYVRAVTIANRGGTTALRGGVKDIDTDEQIGGADVTISANDTNDAIRIEFSGVAPVTGCTGTASTDRINKVAHGYSNNDDIVFTSLTGGAGLTANTVTYWVINANADDFQVSATRGGAAVNITTDYTDMTAARLFRVVAGIDAVEVGHGT